MADAVNAAIHFGQFNLALEWMEQGRSIVWGQMVQLRTPLDELRQHHPNEANELEKISRASTQPGSHIPINWPRQLAAHLNHWRGWHRLTAALQKSMIAY